MVGRTIEKVEAQGKWLKINFSGDLILLTHMLMSGSWHIYRPGEHWKRPRIDQRIMIATEEFVAVAFKVPIAEFHTAATLERRLRLLGPSVLAEELDEPTILANLSSACRIGSGRCLAESVGIGWDRKCIQVRSVL